MRRAGIGALVLFGLLAGQGVTQAQFSFGMTRYGMNPNNPFVAQQQYVANLQAARLAIGAGVAAPAWYPPPRVIVPPLYPPVPSAFTPAMPYYNPYNAYNPYMGGGYGTNPYMAGAGSASNPYSSGGASDPYASNPYASSVGYSNPYSNPAVGPGTTLMGGADVMRAYGTVITSQEQARIMRQKYYEAKLDYQKKKFDLDTYIRLNTPSFTEEQERIGKQILKRIQTQSSPAEVVDGRSLNFLLDDIAKHPGKAPPASDLALDEGILQRINIKPAGTNSYSLGALRNGGKMSWPVAMQAVLTPDARKEIDGRLQALAQNAIAGKEADLNAIKDVRAQLDRADEQLLKLANSLDTPDYSAAKRFIGDLQQSLRAISAGDASAQAQFQQPLTKGSTQNMQDLVRTMVARGWRFGPALPSDEGAYRALHSGLVSYDMALNQMVAASEP